MFDADLFQARRRSRIKQHPAEPSFAHPPLWIHESLAAKCFLGKESPLLISRRREAKRRALLQMLDRIPLRSDRSSDRVLPPAKPAAAPVGDIALPRSTPDARK